MQRVSQKLHTPMLATVSETHGCPLELVLKTTVENITVIVNISGEIVNGAIGILMEIESNYATLSMLWVKFFYR